MHAIVMAAGEGLRLRPLTERYAKPVLPIDGRPVLATLLRDLSAAGVERARIVVGHHAEQIEVLVGDGSGYGLDASFVRQPRPDGSADAVRRALDAGATTPCLVVGADTVFSAGDVASFVADATTTADAIAVRRDPPPSPPARWPVAIREGLVTRVLDDDRSNPLAGAPLWLLGSEVAAHLCVDERPWELGSAYQAAIDAGHEVAAIEIGRTRDLTTPFDILAQNFPYLAAVVRTEASTMDGAR